MSIFELIYLLGWIAAEVIRFPHRMRLKREIREHKLGESRVGAHETIFDMIAFFGTQVLPLFCIFTSWLGFADYSLPAWGGSLGTILFIGCLLLLWRAHSDLGENWSARIELQQEHTLVTRGVYARVRHPIYAALWLWCFAQPLLIQNWIGGFAGLATFALLYFTRVPGEEKLMLDAFGEEYRTYMRNTGRVLPRF
jgi:protein-S-isoprenylcysteine O-methyltransferase Ste14